MNIKIYTTPTCPWCRKTKEFFNQHSIKYTEFDVSSNKKSLEEMIKKSGQRGVPVIDIKGKIVVGFDEQKLKEALRL